MSQSAKPNRPGVLVHRLPDEDDNEEQFKPLEWSLIRRLFTYTAPIKGKVVALGIMTLVRSAQLPALGWLMSLIIQGPISHPAKGFSVGVAGLVIGGSSAVMWGNNSSA